MTADADTGDQIEFIQAIAFELTRPDGTGIPKSGNAQPPSEPEQPVEASLSYTYTFADWNGVEDVLTLSAAYLDEVRDAIAEGVAKGFVTG